MNCPFCGKRLSMAKKWRNRERIILRGIDQEITSVFEPGEVAFCPGVVDGCKFKIFTVLSVQEANRRRASA